MAIPINIEDLLNKRKIESNRIEFKTGWNPVSIYHSICAFANDIDNLGGGYILVGVKEKNGIAERPVEGIPIEKLDSIQKQMVNLNHLIEPYRISILSYAGPDRSISAEAIRLAKSLRSRRYKNRRLGDFLKELGLTEGRATGIPTIQAALEANGSPRATIETDNDRTYFLIDIPCHPTFIGEPFNIKTSSDETANELKDILKDVYYVIKEHPYETMAQLAERVGIGERALKARIDKLKKAGYIGRKGRRHGYWIVLK
jgi:predicted HTH transcriptional regulator